MNMAPSLILKEATTRSEFDAIIDIAWLANYTPYRPLISGIFPISGPTTADREAAIVSSKDRYWKSHISDPSSHWFYVQDPESGEFLGGVQWQVHETNPYPNGPVPFDVDWWPEGEGRNFVAEMLKQLYAARHWWMQRPHIVPNMMSVHPKHRHRGIGGLLTTWGIEQAQKLGLECWLEASEPARFLYEKYGFQTLFKMVLSPEKANPSEEWLRWQHELSPTYFYVMWRPPNGVYEEGKTAMPWTRAIFLSALDTMIMTTALPTIADEFRASDSEFAWIGSAYFLGCLSTVPIWGKVSDIFGRKPILLITNALFLLGSLTGALSPSITALIGGRVIQALGAGGILTLVNICVGDLFSARERGGYYGVIGAVWAFAMACGPLIGGALTERLSWRWCFWINLPFDGLSLILIAFFLDIHTPKASFWKGLKRIGWAGSTTFASASVLVLLGLQFGGVSFPWASSTVICLLVFGILDFAVFVLTQWKIATLPLMPLRLFQSRSVLATLATCFCSSMNAVATIYFLPIYFQLVLSASPITSALYLLPTVIVLGIFCLVTGLLIKLTGSYALLMRTGFVAMAVGIGLFINLQSTLSWPRIVVFQIIAATGLGINYQAPLIAFQAQIAQPDIATGTATFQVVRVFSQAIGIVFGQVIFQSRVQVQVPSLKAAGVDAALLKALETGNTISRVKNIAELTGAQQSACNDAFSITVKD
ncbi:hypothetical protein G7Y89_g3276 [Cudoniella acicularis]|uniref:Major facilitator superfamily (MFS) profile domain-containing protein n=1 Tax=Cudoniella acicularis TaxID=354080 RepID=A0A8H4W5R2_9HELO|nr:hypothetical protein G7Y89_g3276 [Cudoniella acicularis]